jgi:hypothetical protein
LKFKQIKAVKTVQKDVKSDLDEDDEEEEHEHSNRNKIGVIREESEYDYQKDNEPITSSNTNSLNKLIERSLSIGSNTSAGNRSSSPTVLAANLIQSAKNRISPFGKELVNNLLNLSNAPSSNSNIAANNTGLNSTPQQQVVDQGKLQTENLNEQS